MAKTSKSTPKRGPKRNEPTETSPDAIVPSVAAPAPSEKSSPASPVAGAPLRELPAPYDTIAENITKKIWPAKKVIHRIHPSEFGANQFNPGPNGNARFSPIADGAGNPISTIYGGESLQCAAMETVFHDVPHAPGLKTLRKDKLNEKTYSQVEPSQDLVLVDLGAKALRKLGITRADLIETEKPYYPQTRPWAVAVHAQCPEIQGLAWRSRQHGDEIAIVLFEDRLAPATLTSVAPSVSLVDDAPTYSDLLDLAEEIGVDIKA